MTSMGRISEFRMLATMLASVLFALGPAAYAQAPDSAVLAPLKTAYEKNLKAIKDEKAKALANWPTEYLAALTALQSQLQKKGNLEGWKEVKDAIDRFNAEKKIGSPAGAASNPELAAIQAKYRNIVPQSELEKSQKIMALAQKYLAQLTAIQTELTKKNRLEEALAVNAEIKAVKASETYTAADFVLSAHEATNVKKPEIPEKPEPGPTAKADKPVPTVKTSPPPDADSGRRKGEAPPPPAGEEFKIYDKKPPTLAGVTFKNLIVKPTANMGAKRRAVATAMLSSVSDEATDHSSASVRSSSKSKSGSTAHRVRLNIRTTASDAVLENATVVVEYYTKESTASAGKVVPHKALVKLITVPKIDSQGVFIDCPEISTYRYSYRYTSAFSDTYRSKSGQEFYGVIVSVFESDKSLAFQAVSKQPLDDLAAKEIPKEFESDEMGGGRFFGPDDGAIRRFHGEGD